MGVNRLAAHRLTACALACLLFSTVALATVTASPPAVAARPGQNTTTVNVTLNFTPASIPGTGTLAVGGMPAGVSSVPGAVTYSYTVGSPTSSTSFSFAIGSSANPGTYPITLQDTTRDAGITTMMLTITQPSYSVAVSPNPVSLTIGGASRGAAVSASTEPGFNESMITYTINGLPPFIVNDGPKQTFGPGYAPVNFNLSLSAGASPGTYMGTVNGQSTGGQAKSAPITVIIQQTDINATFSAPSMTVCNGAAPASNAIQLTPVNGYEGTPQVAFSNVPPGITISPLSPSANSMPPAQSIPFTVSADGATPGVKNATLTITDAAAGISRMLNLQVIVSTAEFTAAVTPSVIGLTAGGASAPVSASILSSGCSPGPVAVTVSGAPAGLLITPAATTIQPPAHAPVSFSISAAPSVAPGSYPVTFTFGAAGVARTSIVQVSVSAAPDFVVAAQPASLTIPSGTSSATTITVTPVNGFAGAVSISAPVSPGISFSAATFNVSAGGSQAVTIAVGAGAAAGPRSLAFTASSPSIIGTRTAALTLNVQEGGDFALSVTPPVADIRPSGSVAVTVRAAALNGFAGTIQVSAPATPGLTFTPASFALAPAASQIVTIQAAALTPGTSLPLTFTASAPGMATPRTAQLGLRVVAPAPILTSATPPALVAGTSSTLIRVAGDFLQSGARFVSSNPSVTVDGASVLSSKLADVRISVRGGATPGPRELTVVNPDGGTSATPLLLIVYPTSSIAAPLAVTSAAIVYPPRGTMIANGDKVHPRGLLATSGTGTIIGSWRFDGAPFDRFVANVGAGMPVEVRSNVPIPTSYAGSHILELVIESPRQVVSPSIEVLSSIDRASQLMLLAPPEGAVLRGAQQLFRWSLVPNCSAYFVEVAMTVETKQPNVQPKILRFRVADAEWRPTADDLKAIGSGIRRWRVRPVCAGETELEATGWRRFALLPEEVEVSLLPPATDRRNARVLQWSSEVAGLLHRVEFLAPNGATLFSALTPRSDYALPPATFPAGTAVRVSAIAPGGVVLGTSNSLALPRTSASSIRLIDQILVELGQTLPADGATVASAQPRITAEWKGAVSNERVSLHLDNVDITPVSTILATSITYDPLVAVQPGVHTVTLNVAGQKRQWTFTVVPAADAGTTKANGFRGDWVITPVGTVTLVRDANNQARSQISGQTDLANGAFSNKSTGDVSIRHDFDRGATVQESRNWLFDLGAQQGVVTEALRVGFSQPDFLDQAQFLSTGIARGGAQAKVALPLGIASYYQTFTVKPAGVSSGNFGPDQRVRAAAFQSRTHPRWDFRLLGIAVDDYAGINSAGGKGDALGVFLRYTRGPALRAVVEGARGTFDPAAASLQSPVTGSAWRLGLDGTARTVTYALNARKTDAGFVNPANRGFTAGGVPDRIGGDLSLSKPFGLTTVMVQFRHAQDGTAPEVLLVPKTQQSGVSVSVLRAFGQHMSLSAAANGTLDTGDSLVALYMPETDRTSAGASVTLSEFFGRYAFSQTVSRQDLRDRINVLSSQQTSALTLTAGGTFTQSFSVAGVLSGTRSEGSVVFGATDIVTASLQPVINIAGLFLSLQPRASYTKSMNDLLATETASEQYQALMTFSPTWFDSTFAMQLSADWTRTQFTGSTQPAPYTRRYVATINLHRRLGTLAAAQ